MIKRYQWEDDNQPKGYSKTIRPWHLNDGQFKMGKGCLEWDPYRLEEAMVHGQNKWIIGVEGENCVEDARSLGLAAITYQGASWGEVELGTGLGLLNSGGVNGMVFISDADETGDKKTKALLEASGKVKFPVLIISSSKLWEECPNKGDISDWIQWVKNKV
jgi:putative DNA primase/helicase